jgi:16S rRNA (cytosine967-C5)-methyltransferase
MRLGGRASAAIEVLNDMAVRHRPASEALRDWGLSHRFAGGGDRAAIGNLVYDTLRKRASQAWCAGSDDAIGLVLMTLLGQWNYGVDELATEFAEDRHAPELPPAGQLASWLASDLAQAPAYVRADIPEWCAPHFEQSFGEDWIAEAQALAERPPLDLRVNTLKSTRDKVAKQLARFDAKPSPLAPSGLRIAPGTRAVRLPNVQAEAAFQKGWFEVQDEGSQLAALATNVKPGEQVFDYCAGAGGKTLALAAAMENKGQIYAHDSNRLRLAPIHDRLKRASVRNVQVLAPAADLSDFAGRMDCVLVDAPCTGSGTWRRRPDAKWRLDEAALEARMVEQDTILAEASLLVRPGGRLVYVTCSVFAGENGDRIAAFLAKHPDFTLQSTGEPFAQMCHSAQCRIVGGSMVALTAKRTGTDGFFFATLVKV